MAGAEIEVSLISPDTAGLFVSLYSLVELHWIEP